MIIRHAPCVGGCAAAVFLSTFDAEGLVPCSSRVNHNSLRASEKRDELSSSLLVVLVVPEDQDRGCQHYENGTDDLSEVRGPDTIR